MLISPFIDQCSLHYIYVSLTGIQLGILSSDIYKVHSITVSRDTVMRAPIICKY